MARILVVDDDAASRSFVTTLLRANGHEVLEASDGAQALSISERTRPALIIADILMPEMDGYEFARRLRSGGAVASIIFYTAAYHRESAHALAEACGVTCVLAKPGAPQVILDSVASVLAGPAGAARDVPPTFHEEHARVLTQKVFDQLEELREVNERLRGSESQYRTLFETNPFPIWILDRESLRFLAVNEAAVRHYGYSREEFERLPLRDIFADGSPHVLAADRRTDRGGFLHAPEIIRHRTKEGAVIEVEVFTQSTSFSGRPALRVLLQDVTERNRAQHRIRESEEQLHRLTVRLRSAQEEERTRVARYLHDELGQMLTALRLTCSSIAPGLGPDLAQRMRSCIKLTDEMVVAVQRLSTELRPGVLDLGIGAAIEWHLREFESRSRIDCAVEMPGEEQLLDSGVATEVYRIFQEALTNIARHAGATRVSVALKQQPSTLLLEVSDNGRGITAEELNSRSAIGLLGMRERAALVGGTVAIEGNPASGTTVRVVVPTCAAGTG